MKIIKIIFAFAVMLSIIMTASLPVQGYSSGVHMSIMEGAVRAGVNDGIYGDFTSEYVKKKFNDMLGNITRMREYAIKPDSIETDKGTMAGHFAIPIYNKSGAITGYKSYTGSTSLNAVNSFKKHYNSAWTWFTKYVSASRSADYYKAKYGTFNGNYTRYSNDAIKYYQSVLDELSMATHYMGDLNCVTHVCENMSAKNFPHLYSESIWEDNIPAQIFSIDVPADSYSYVKSFTGTRDKLLTELINNSITLARSYEQQMRASAGSGLIDRQFFINDEAAVIAIGNDTMRNAVKYTALFLYKFWMDAENYQAKSSVKY